MKIKHDDKIWTIWEVTSDQVVRKSLTKEMTFKLKPREFPGGPVAKTPCSRCRGPGFDPWLGN